MPSKKKLKQFPPNIYIHILHIISQWRERPLTSTQPTHQACSPCNGVSPPIWGVMMSEWINFADPSYILLASSECANQISHPDLHNHNAIAITTTIAMASPPLLTCHHHYYNHAITTTTIMPSPPLLAINVATTTNAITIHSILSLLLPPPTTTTSSPS